MLKPFLSAFCAVLTGCALFGFVGCAKHNASNVVKDEQFVQANRQLNEKHFEEAIPTLEGLSQRYPESLEVKRKLMHAHAGAAGFESLKFKQQLESILNASDKFKIPDLKVTAEEMRRDLRGARKLDPVALQKLKIYRFTGSLAKLMEGAPTLNSPEFAHLNRAIRLYDELGLNPETSSPDDNFKWGVLYCYRIVATAHHLVQTLDGIAKDPERSSGGDADKYFISAGDRMGRDAARAVKLFAHSYAKLRDVAAAVDRVVDKATGTKLRSELLAQGRPAAEVLQNFMRDNQALTEQFAAKLDERIRANGMEGTLRALLSQAYGDSPDFRYRRTRVRAIVRVYLRDLKESKAGEISEAKYITRQLFGELANAADEAGKQKSLAPFELLAREQRSQVYRLIEIGKALSDDLDESGLADDLRHEVLALREAVEREQINVLREEIKATAADMKAMGEDYDSRQAELIRLAGDRLTARGKKISDVLRSELQGELDNLRAALAAKDPHLSSNEKRTRTLEDSAKQ